jgi:putative tryptophan/tyrosine transport system substrate-binding protein
MAVEMGPKRLDFIHQLVPKATTIAMLVNPNFPTALAETHVVQDAARAFGVQINVLKTGTEGEIESAFANLTQQKIGALMRTDPFLLGQRDQIAGLAARHAVPTMYFLREFVQAGGLMSYGPDVLRPASTRATF